MYYNLDLKIETHVQEINGKRFHSYQIFFFIPCTYINTLRGYFTVNSRNVQER